MGTASRVEHESAQSAARCGFGRLQSRRTVEPRFSLCMTGSFARRGEYGGSRNQKLPTTDHSVFVMQMLKSSRT